MQNNGRIYWLTGQSGSGKTAIAQKLKIWLASEKRNWRKSVHIIDESDLENKFTEESHSVIAYYISRFLSEKGDDVIVALHSPDRTQREEFKSKTKIFEIYCHTKSRQGRGINMYYEPPLENFANLDTTADVESTFKKLVKLMV
jgi:adenylylsulfate kinase-like enzyme